MKSLVSLLAILGSAAAYGECNFLGTLKAVMMGRCAARHRASPTDITRVRHLSSPGPQSVVSLFTTIAPSFVPRSHGVVSPMAKHVVASQVYGSKTRRASSGAASVKMMPIGVPKVAYRVPGSQQADW